MSLNIHFSVLHIFLGNYKSICMSFLLHKAPYLLQKDLKKNTLNIEQKSRKTQPEKG